MIENDFFSHIDDDSISSDSVAVKWDGNNLINEGIIKEGTKIQVGKLLNIGGVNFEINSIYNAIPGLYYIDTNHGKYSIKTADRNNFDAYKYYEKTRNN